MCATGAWPAAVEPAAKGWRGNARPQGLAHALRFAASSGQRVLSMRNISSALKMERPYVMDGEPIGRRWGTHAESKRRGSLVS